MKAMSRVRQSRWIEILGTFQVSVVATIIKRRSVYASAILIIARNAETHAYNGSMPGYSILTTQRKRKDQNAEAFRCTTSTAIIVAVVVPRACRKNAWLVATEATEPKIVQTV